MELEEAGHHQDNVSQSHQLPPSEACNFGGFPMMYAFSMTVDSAMVLIPRFRGGGEPPPSFKVFFFLIFYYYYLLNFEGILCKF
jgi:hypothetical protein